MPQHFTIALILSLLVLNHPRPLKQDAQHAFDDCRIVTSPDLKDKHAPTFAEYRATASQSPGRPKLDLGSNPVARTYRTVLRQEVALGANFAGHYRVAVWGCGTSCAQFAVINLNTGRVITPNGLSNTSGVHFEVETKGAFPNSQSDAGLFAFRKDSRLLIVLGDLDEDESREGAFYFVLESERLGLVHSTIVDKDCDNLRKSN